MPRGLPPQARKSSACRPVRQCGLMLELGVLSLYVELRGAGKTGVRRWVHVCSVFIGIRPSRQESGWSMADCVWRWHPSRVRRSVRSEPVVDPIDLRLMAWNPPGSIPERESPARIWSGVAKANRFG